MDIATLQQLDQQHVWHPCSQMKDYELFKPLVVKKAYGSTIELSNGQKIIDAISSWWCKSLGHNHPRLKKALMRQLEQFEHIILANTTNPLIVELSQQLAHLLPPLDKIFYAGDGSCAVEIALKMSLHARVNQGDSKRNQFIALSNGYHGETAGALSVSDLGLYRKPYTAMLFETHFIENIPYVSGLEDPTWKDCSAIWNQVQASLAPFEKTATALIVEPILQGAGQMKIYSADFLRRLAKWAKAHDIHLIADEILTGIGRTGKMLACHYADIIPDFICLSKGLTSGWLPLSAVLTHDEIYQYFYDDYETGKAFLHSQTYCGNALAVAVALETLKIIQNENLYYRAQILQSQMRQHMTAIAEHTGQLTNIRGIGAVVAADIITDTPHKRVGYEVYRQAVKLGALLRPLGNTLYWLPPLNIEENTLEELKHITQAAIMQVCAGQRSSIQANAETQ